MEQFFVHGYVSQFSYCLDLSLLVFPEIKIFFYDTSAIHFKRRIDLVPDLNAMLYIVIIAAVCSERKSNLPTPLI